MKRERNIENIIIILLKEHNVIIERSFKRNKRKYIKSNYIIHII